MANKCVIEACVFLVTGDEPPCLVQRDARAIDVHSGLKVVEGQQVAPTDSTRQYHLPLKLKVVVQVSWVVQLEQTGLKLLCLMPSIRYDYAALVQVCVLNVADVH